MGNRRYASQVTPEELSAAIAACLKDAIEVGEFNIEVPTEVRVERPRNRQHGDWATNIALQIGKEAGMSPREFAQLLSNRLNGIDGVKSIDIAGPGFLNITLDDGAAGELARVIIEKG